MTMHEINVTVDLDDLAAQLDAGDVVEAFGMSDLVDAMDPHEVLDKLHEEDQTLTWCRDSLEACDLQFILEDQRPEALRELGEMLGSRCAAGAQGALKLSALRIFVHGLVQGLRPGLCNLELADGVCELIDKA